MKICGITRENDARMAVRAGATAIGTVVVAKSPRAVTPRRARQIMSAAEGARTVMVTASDDPAEVLSLAQVTQPDLIQLHGASWSPGLLACVRGQLPGSIGLIRPVGVLAEGDPGSLLEHCRACAPCVEALLLDSAHHGLEGGTGQTHDWGISRWLRESLPETRVILAGGLNPGNVGEAISRVKPFGVDVSSGVESRPGMKDPRLVGDFIAAARGST